MKALNRNKNKNRTATGVTGDSNSSRKSLLPALMALGGACGMMAVPAAALELGQLEIDSALGQPLRASIAYALNPNEQLYDFCVYLRPGLAATGLPGLSKATVSIADGAILLSGSRAIREPLLTMQVSIDCPYTAHLSREYTLMINPAQPTVEAVAAAASSAVERTVAATSTTNSESAKPRPPVESRRTVKRSPVSESNRYLVQRGDSLSDIASRISDRSIALWPAVDLIFTENPDAFMNSDRNQLKAGSWLVIPDLSGATPEPITSEAVATAAVRPAVMPSDSTAYASYETTAARPEQTITPTGETPVTAMTGGSEAVEPLISEPDSAASDFANLQPGDVIVGDDNPFVSPIGTPADADTSESIIIPDTEIFDPVVVQPVAVVNTSQDSANKINTGGAWSWFTWLGGTGLALILGLLLFGQKIRQRFGSLAVGLASATSANRRRTDSDTQKTKAMVDVDFQVPDSSPHASSFTLDADFDDGTGLQDSSEMDVAQDFGFSASATFDEELDMVLPEPTGEEEKISPTDIIPPPEIEDHLSILESEVLPGEDEDNGDYDLSMIVDVTKQNVLEVDATAKDLQAVLIESGDDLEADDYTVSQEVDYKVLEQDYEDEFTATQALNEEITRAAAELAERMDNDASSQITTNLPINTQAQNDDINDLDDTGINEEVTAELPGADNDVTVGMEIESGKIDTKKRAS